MGLVGLTNTPVYISHVEYSHCGLFLLPVLKGCEHVLVFVLHCSVQGIYNCSGIKCKNGRLEIASRIINHFFLVVKIFVQFLLDESCIYSAHNGTYN